MIDASHPFLRLLRLSLLHLALSSFALGAALADDDRYSGPAVTTTDSMSDHMGRTENPRDMVAGTEDPDGMVVDTESPDGMAVRSQNPDAMGAATESPDELEGRTHDLADLPTEKPEAGYESIMLPGQEDWAPSSDPEVIVARRKLERAQERAQAARTRYGEMMQRNYPRGEARLRIVRERDEAMAELDAAKHALQALDGGAPASNR